MSDYAKITHTLAADTHNLKILENGFTERVLLNPTGANRSLTGIQPPPHSLTRLLLVENISATYSVSMPANDSGSDDANRFSSLVTVRPGELAVLFYEPAVSRWRAPAPQMSRLDVDHRVLVASGEVDGSDNMTIDFGVTASVKLILDQNVNALTLTPPAVATGKATSLMLELEQDGTARTIASWSGVVFYASTTSFYSGGIPLLSTTDGYVDVVALRYAAADATLRGMYTPGAST